MTRPLEKVLELRADKNGFVNIPVLSHIEGNLYCGMSPCYWGGGHENFSTIFDFYSGCLLDNDPDHYEVVPPTKRRIFKVYDSHQVPSKEKIFEIADMIVAAQQTGLTLVHCQMGVNRSNLFLAAALWRMGKRISEAVCLLRIRRSPYVLQNHYFCQGT